ncbi:MAG: hypothetical protein ACXWZB_06660 [Gaiellaceae bacterium]
MIWEVVFMLVILKIPVVYLCLVVWWAIRAEPEPLEGAGLLAAIEPRRPDCDWRGRRADARRRGPPPRPQPGSRTVARGRLRA